MLQITLEELEHPTSGKQVYQRVMKATFLQGSWSKLIQLDKH